MFAFATSRPARRPSLTPMIDVVFLLLVFFMLAARFGTDATLPLTTAGAGAPYEGPPRLVMLTQAGVTLNGLATSDITGALAPLMRASSDAILVKAKDGVSTQALVTLLDELRAAGLTQVVVVE